MKCDAKNWTQKIVNELTADLLRNCGEIVDIMGGRVDGHDGELKFIKITPELNTENEKRKSQHKMSGFAFGEQIISWLIDRFNKSAAENDIKSPSKNERAFCATSQNSKQIFTNFDKFDETNRAFPPTIERNSAHKSANNPQNVASGSEIV